MNEEISSGLSVPMKTSALFQDVFVRFQGARRSVKPIGMRHPKVSKGRCIFTIATDLRPIGAPTSMRMRGP